MQTLFRWFKKDFWVKKNFGLCLLGLFAAFAIGYPFVVFRLGESAWLDWCIDGCPFFFQIFFVASLACKILPFLEYNSMLLEISYYIIWAIMILGVLLVYKGIKFGKIIVCLLLLWDIVPNLVGKHYVAVIIDIVMLVLALRAKKKLGDDEPLY